MSDKLPPFSLEAEQSCLGACLTSKEALLECVTIFGTADAFYETKHQVLFELMVGMWRDGIPVDLRTVCQRISDVGQIDQCGSIVYVCWLPDACPAASGVEYFAQIVMEKWELRRMVAVCTRIVADIYADQSNPEQLISLAEQEVLAVRRKTGQDTAEMKSLVLKATEAIERVYLSGGEIGGMSTGLTDLDRATDGLHAGELVILAGYPGGGKTALAMNIAEQVSLVDRSPVGIFTLEMSAERLVQRMISSQSRLNMRSVRHGTMSEEQFKAFTVASAKLANAPMHFCDKTGLSISQVRARARGMIQKDVKLFIVDYLQLLAGAGKQDQNREQEVSSISRGLKQMAGEFNVPVIALSQLNDDGKLRESRAIGQDADSVWKLKALDSDGRSVRLEIIKQRDGLAPAFVDLAFLKEFTRFENAAKISDNDKPKDTHEKRQIRNTHAD